MKTNFSETLKRLWHKVLPAALVLFCLITVKSAYAQDPPQYGTPFSGVPYPMDANIYQVNIRAFSAGSNLAGVTARLDQIKALGINVVYLMPTYPVGTDSKSINSPYSIKDFQAVGAEYGTLSDLRALVAGAHSRGMAVLMDFVVNGTSWDNAWITQHPDWYVRNSSGVIQQLGSYSDVAALNFANTSMRTALINAMRYWIFAANIDGYRCDYANNPPADFWTQAISNLRGITSHKLLMLAEGDRSANYTSGFDYNFGFGFYSSALVPIHGGSSVSSLIPTWNNNDYTGATGSQQIVRYTDNQDINGNNGATALSVFGGTAGVMANYVVCAYMKSVPFLYNGQEIAFTTPIPFPWTSVDINWSAANTSVTAEFTNVIGYRNTSIAVRRGTMTDYSDANICAFSKVSGTEKVVVLVNMRGGSNTYTIPGGLAGNYKDAYSGTAKTLTSGAQITLTPFQYIVLTNQGAGTTYFQILNRWKANTYLYDSGNGKVSYGTSPGATSYQWALVDAGNGFLFLKNRATGNLMNVQDQNGSIECNTTNYALYSAMWSTPNADTGWINIQNRYQTADLINIEALTGYAQYSGAQSSFYSATWQFVNPVNVP